VRVKIPLSVQYSILYHLYLECERIIVISNSAAGQIHTFSCPRFDQATVRTVVGVANAISEHPCNQAFVLGVFLLKNSVRVLCPCPSEDSPGFQGLGALLNFYTYVRGLESFRSTDQKHGASCRIQCRVRWHLIGPVSCR